MYHKFLFTLLIAGASLHAMESDDLKIVQYDVAKHGPAIQSLFVEAFAQEPMRNLMMHNRKCSLKLIELSLIQCLDPERNVAVLTKEDQPIGLAIWQHELLHTHQTFPDVFKESHAMLNVCRLHYLAIDPQYRKTKERSGKKSGTKLLQYIKKTAEENGDDIIALKAAYHSKKFYLKSKFIKTTPYSPVDLMGFPLNEDVKDILQEVITQRKENHTKGNAFSFTTDLI